MVNITNTKSCPYISLPMYKPTKKCLRTNISPGLIFGGLRYIYKLFTSISKLCFLIIVVNGDAGSRLEVKLDKPSTVHAWCDKKCDWSTIWLSVEELSYFLIDCFTDNMRY